MKHDDKCLQMTKKGSQPNFIQKLVGCSNSNSTLCMESSQGGEICLKGVSNKGQMTGCMMMPPKKLDMENITTKVEVNCNDPSSECKMQ